MPVGPNQSQGEIECKGTVWDAGGEQLQAVAKHQLQQAVQRAGQMVSGSVCRTS